MSPLRASLHPSSMSHVTLILIIMLSFPFTLLNFLPILLICFAFRMTSWVPLITVNTCFRHVYSSLIPILPFFFSGRPCLCYRAFHNKCIQLLFVSVLSNLLALPLPFDYCIYSKDTCYHLYIAFAILTATSGYAFLKFSKFILAISSTNTL